MRRSLLRGFVVSVALIAGGVGSGPPADASASRAGRAGTPPASPVPGTHPTHFPLLLVENRGQTDADVVAYVRGRDTTVHFTRDGVTYSLRGAGQRWTVKADFVGANPRAVTELLDPAPTLISYFKGPRSQWKTGLRTFREIAYRDLWPGIDLVWTAATDRLKYEFVVRPGADPSRIKVAWCGATGVAVGAAGALELTTPVAVLSDAAPVSFQDVGGRRVAVRSEYALGGDDGANVRTSGFRVGEYDANLPLVIDPASILYSGYIGGDGDDIATGVAVEDGGSAFVSGYTSASEPTFPRIAGPDLTQNGDVDAFVAKVAPGGASLVYVGYIGGDGVDRASGIAADPGGHAYVVGDTASGASSFPFVVGPSQARALEDGFVAKVSADGTSLTWCGYIGGNLNDLATGVALDQNDNVYVTGTTTSSQATFPATVGPRLTKDASTDAFVAKVRADGTGFVYAGFIGGSGQGDEGHGIAVDGDGAAYVAGRTDGAAFPTTVGPGLTAKGGRDAFVAKVRPDGAGLVYAGLISGIGDDTANGVAVDVLKRAYVCGTTVSDETSFPVKVGPDLVFGVNVGPPLIRQDAFVARVTADGAGLEYCGYIGGKQADTATGIAVNPLGEAFVTGSTYSGGGYPAPTPQDVGFPLISGPGSDHRTAAFDEAAYLVRVRAGGGGFVAGGVIDGATEDHGNAVALGDAGNGYVVGSSLSAQVSFPLLIGPDLTRNEPPTKNARDAFITKVASPLALAPVNSYLLPVKVTAKPGGSPKRGTAPKPSLTVSGTVDFGTIDPCWTLASTLDVGGLHFDIPAFTTSKASHVYSGGGLTFSVTPSAGGSSKAAFTLSYVGDLSGKVALDGDLAMRFATDTTTSSATVRLASGRFKLSAPHGGFVEPCIFIGRATGKLLGEAKDSLSLSLGVATDGTTPPAPSAVVITFGGFSRTFDASQFKRKGTKDVFTDRKGDITSVVVDYVKQSVTVTGKKLTLGSFAPGANDVAVTVELGGTIHEVDVELGRSGTSLSY